MKGSFCCRYSQMYGAVVAFYEQIPESETTSDMRATLQVEAEVKREGGRKRGRGGGRAKEGWRKRTKDGGEEGERD